MKMTGMLAIAGLLALGCDSMVDAEEELNKNNQLSESQSLENGLLTAGNVITVTEKTSGHLTDQKGLAMKVMRYQITIGILLLTTGVMP